MSSSRIKHLPIGITNFKKVIDNYYFVDKSYFIEELLQNQSEVTLCIRPRRFGKSLILSMLKYFFTLENAEENRKLFNNLAISKSEYMDRQGKSPVIFFSMKEIRGDTFDEFLQNIVFDISSLYQSYLYLLESSELSSFDKKFYKKICSGEGTKIEDIVLKQTWNENIRIREWVPQE